MEEIWRPVVGFEGYEVSNFGRVRSLNYHQTGQVRVLKSCKNKYGYLCVVLCKNRKPKSYKVHRLVATAFIPNPDNLPEVNHINEDKTDNRVENLSWVSHIQNMRYGTCIERVSKALTNRNDMSKPVGQYTREWVLIGTYPSIREVCRQKGYDDASICRVCNNKRKTAYGYYWQYV